MTPDDEERRHRCEVRQWIAWRVANGREWLAQKLVEIAKSRGSAAAKRIKDDIAKQWERGNRGGKGEWM